MNDNQPSLIQNTVAGLKPLKKSADDGESKGNMG